jgi:hypothetical protein
LLFCFCFYLETFLKRWKSALMWVYSTQIAINILYNVCPPSVTRFDDSLLSWEESRSISHSVCKQSLRSHELEWLHVWESSSSFIIITLACQLLCQQCRKYQKYLILLRSQRQPNNKQTKFKLIEYHRSIWVNIKSKKKSI